ncbi:MAG: TonB-dependent receptor plug domain-containing protein [Bacteroidota bacterium]
MKPVNYLFLATLFVSLLGLSSSCTSSSGIAQDQASMLQNAQAGDMAELLRRQPNLMVAGSGANISLQVRGKKSLTASNEPLMVVDGYRLGEGYQAVAHLNPGEVARIRIITDPNELISYGIGAANGVVDIRLK